MLDVVGVGIGADVSGWRDVLVRGLVVCGCRWTRDGRRRRHIGGCFREGFKSELKGAQGTQGREGSDIPVRVIDKGGLVREAVEVTVNGRHSSIGIWRRRWRGQVPSMVVVVGIIFHAPGWWGVGGGSQRVL